MHRRVHPDEHPLDELERDAVIGDEEVLRGGVGLPVAADREDVSGLGDRPEAGIFRGLGDAAAPVDGAALAQLGEDRVGRTLLP